MREWRQYGIRPPALIDGVRGAPVLHPTKPLSNRWWHRLRRSGLIIEHHLDRFRGGDDLAVGVPHLVAKRKRVLPIC